MIETLLTYSESFNTRMLASRFRISQTAKESWIRKGWLFGNYLSPMHGIQKFFVIDTPQSLFGPLQTKRIFAEMSTTIAHSFALSKQCIIHRTFGTKETGNDGAPVCLLLCRPKSKSVTYLQRWDYQDGIVRCAMSLSSLRQQESPGSLCVSMIYITSTEMRLVSQIATPELKNETKPTCTKENMWSMGDTSLIPPVGLVRPQHSNGTVEKWQRNNLRPTTLNLTTGNYRHESYENIGDEIRRLGADILPSCVT